MSNDFSEQTLDDEKDLKPDFIWEETKNSSKKICYFVAISHFGDIKYDKLHNVILLPLTSDTNKYESLYKKFCDIGCIVNGGESGIFNEWELFKSDSVKNEDLVLNIGCKGTVENTMYFNIRLCQPLERGKKIGILQCQYSNILSGQISEPDFIPIYQKIIGSHFDESIYKTYETLSNEFNSRIERVSSDRSKDLEKFNDSYLGETWKDHLTQYETLKGVYTEKGRDIGIVDFMNNNYIKSGCLGKNFDPWTESKGRLWMTRYRSAWWDTVRVLFYGNLYPNNNTFRLDQWLDSQ